MWQHESSDACLCSLIIRATDHEWFIATSEVINTIDPFYMTIQCKIWVRGAKIPNLEQVS